MTARNDPQTDPEQNPTLDVAIAAAWCRSSRELPRILITRRPAHVHLGDLWELPGGKIDPGESPANAAARELLEETGLHGADPLPLLTHRHIYEDRIVILHAFTIEVDAPVAVEPSEAITDARWITASAMTDISFPPANAPITDACMAFLEQRAAAP